MFSLCVLAQLSLETSGMSLVIACAAFGLLVAVGLIRSILKVKIEHQRMREIAAAIEEGAKE